jgi:Vitamin-D-receptor interacting Mediator subunit 4
MTVDDTVMEASNELSLLDKVEAALRVEQQLTAALDRAGPWLDGAPVRAHQRRVRPVPQTMEQAEHVLKYARVLSNRTSAPAGWNPNAPVVGFSTPNPLPHQLRGGALAALQLERARQRQVRQQLERSHKILHDREESDREKMMVQVENEKGQGEAEEDAAGDGTSRDPKRRDVVAHQQQDSAAAAAKAAPGAGQRAGATAAAAAVAAQRPVASQLDVSMNLSSDSSSEEEDEDD